MRPPDPTRPHLLEERRSGGVLDTLILALEDGAGQLSFDGGARYLAQVLQAEQGRGPRELVAGTRRYHTGWYQPLVDVLVEARPPLRALHLGDFYFPDKWGEYVPEDLDKDGEGWVTSLGFLDGLWRALPALEMVGLHANDLTLGPLGLPRLRSFTLRTECASNELVATLGAARLPALEHLDLGLGNFAYGFGGEARELAPLLSGEGLPALCHLTLVLDLIDDLVGMLLASPLLPRLQVLDLAGGGLSDRGGMRLARERDALAHLQLLDLRGNRLTPATCLALRELRCPVFLDDQRPADQGPLVVRAPAWLHPAVAAYTEVHGRPPGE